MCYRRVFLFLIGFPFFLFSQESESSFIKQGDSAFASYDNQAALESYLKVITITPDNYEANWKLSRAYVDIGENFEDEEKRAEYYSESEKRARAAIKSNPEGSNGHLYLSIALGRVALDAGPKERIKMSKEIKEEVDIAIKLEPKNDLAYHVLGRWNRKISNLSWIEKSFADIFLGGVPKNASNEEAVINFKKALELKPEYINHSLELGITYEMMDLENLAIESFKRCIDIKSNNPKDKKYKRIAQEHLDDLI